MFVDSRKSLLKHAKEEWAEVYRIHAPHRILLEHTHLTIIITSCMNLSSVRTVCIGVSLVSLIIS